MSNQVQINAFGRAAGLLGGPGELRDHLQVPSYELARWMSDSTAAPLWAFLKVVDLIVGHDPAWPVSEHPHDRAVELT